jgi:hypothetical protein
MCGGSILARTAPVLTENLLSTTTEYQRAFDSLTKCIWVMFAPSGKAIELDMATLRLAEKEEAIYVSTHLSMTDWMC